MNDVPLVSVIVPVYNVAPYLPQCIDSLINQTLQDIEIICVNDGSTDVSPKILQDYAKRYFNIKVINQGNGGQSAARNAGIEIAKGAYIGFVDGDDWVALPERYENIYRNAKEHRVDIIIDNIGCYSDKRSKQYRDEFFCNDTLPVSFEKPMNTERILPILFEMNVSPCNKIVKTSIFRENNIRFIDELIYEDNLYHLDIFLYAKTCLFMKQIGYVYRTDRNGSTMNEYKRSIEIFNISCTIIDRINCFSEDIYFKDNVMKYLFKKQYDLLKRISENVQEKFYVGMIDFWNNVSFDKSSQVKKDILGSIVKFKKVGYKKWKKRDIIRSMTMLLLKVLGMEYPIKNLRLRFKRAKDKKRLFLYE